MRLCSGVGLVAEGGACGWLFFFGFLLGGGFYFVYICKKVASSTCFVLFATLISCETGWYIGRSVRF